MIYKQILKKISFLVLLSIVSCSGVKKTDINDEYKNYKIAQGIKLDSVLPFQHFKSFLEYKKQQKRQSLLNDRILKVNKIYVYQADKKTFTFCVFSEDGYLYMGEAYKSGGMLLAEPEDRKIEIKNSIELNFLGFFELEDNVIKISRHEKIPRGEKNQSDWGNIKNDTITLTKMYNTKKYGYTKNWLAKTHKTNFKLIYQPDLIAIKSKNQSGFDAFRIQGSFNLEENLKVDKTLELMENVKY